MEVIRTVIADDHRIVAEGIKALLKTKNAGPECRILATIPNGADLVRFVNNTPIDLLILDFNLSEMDGMEVIHQIKSLEKRDLKILVLSAVEDVQKVNLALRLGADGYLLKSGTHEQLFKAIDDILLGNSYVSEEVTTSGVGGLSRSDNRQPVSQSAMYEVRSKRKFNLTKRELQILRLIIQALSNKEIAKELYISDQTVSVHRKNIMRKMGVSNTAGLIKTAYDNSLV